MPPFFYDSTGAMNIANADFNVFGTQANTNTGTSVGNIGSNFYPTATQSQPTQPDIIDPKLPENDAFSTFDPKSYAGIGMMASGLQSLGSIWNAYQQNKMAKASFGLQKEAYETNMGHQVKSYNTQLEDRARARYITEGKSEEEINAYVEKNRL